MSKSSTTIRPSPALRGYIEGSTKGATAALNDLFDRYQVLRNQSTLKITQQEVDVIHAMLFGVAMNDNQFLIACLALPQDIYDEDFIYMAGAESLAKKFSTATPAQLVATVDSLGY